MFRIDLITLHACLAFVLNSTICNPDCDVNCHKKCEKLMPNLCGMKQKLMVEALTTLKKGK